jgi:hypothetical protein
MEGAPLHAGPQSTDAGRAQQGLHASTCRVHVVCFEESGSCVLERIARTARPGDRVLSLGPESWAFGLRALGLPSGVEIESIGRAYGRYAVAGRVRQGMALAYGPRAARATGAALIGPPAELPVVATWPAERRARLRRELGVQPNEHAVLVAGEPSEWLDLSFAMRAVAMARVAGRQLRPVVSPRAPRLAAVARCLEGAAPSPSSRDRREPIAVDDRADRPWELLPAVDAIVLDRDGLATHPIACAGWRGYAVGLSPLEVSPGEIPPGETPPGEMPPWEMSPLPALWALACGVPVFAHASIDLGRHGTHPLVVRFADDVAQLARDLHARVGPPSDQARESSASAASR